MATRRGHHPGGQEKGKGMGQITAVVVDPGGDAWVCSLEDDFRVYQDLVGGHIEGVFGPGFVMYVNEEGMYDLPHNASASAFVKARSGRDVALFGTVVILGPGDGCGNDTSVQQDTIDYYKEH